MLDTLEVTFARAIADDTRQHIMRHLCCQWLSVGDVVTALGGRVNQPTVSHHLKKLEEAGLVQVRQQGRQRFYTLDQSRVTMCCGQLVHTFAPDHAGQPQGEQVVNNPIIPIHAVVQDRYGTIAAMGSGACCGPDGCDPASPNAQLYAPALTADLPASVTDISLGCGDPVTIASLKPGETVLDLGSGGGIDCFLAARQVGESGYVIGVDMTPEMLRRANENKARLSAHNVEFRRGQIEALPVVADSIDVIMSNCVINLSPDKAAVFSEALRVLRPGGRISVSDIVTEGEFTPEMRADAARWAECVTGAIPAEQYIGLMRDAGFVDITVIDQTDAEGIVERQPGMPRLFSARITARKPSHVGALACQAFAIPAAERSAYVTLRDGLLASALRMEPLADGWRFHLPAARLAEASQWVAWERLCCPFLRFEITLAPPYQALQVTMRGEGPVREFLAAELGISAHRAN